MSQRAAKTVRVALVKGLVTESTPLNHPPEASIDELNVDLRRDTTRPKREGFNVEPFGTYFGSVGDMSNSGSSYIWEYPSGVKDKTYLVVQEGLVLAFYDMRISPMSLGRQTFTVSLMDFSHTGPVGRVSMVSVKGRLVVAGEGLNTFRVTYDPSSDSVSTEVITFRIRDFEYVGDKVQYLTRGSSTSDSVRRYDTFNSGWTTKYLGYFIDRHKGLPELNRPHYASKDKDGYPAVRDGWDKTEGGNTLITNGHYILDLYVMDRDAASGIGGINLAATAKGLGPESSRFSTVANFAGRIFYAGMTSSRSSGRVYFSQVVQDGNELGDLYSINDPTAEYLSDLLDTDGGWVNIPEAEGINHLHVFGTHLLVFASNGVWSVSGVDDVFRATEYTVNRISGTGLTHPASFVSAEGRPYWWSDTGIHTVSMTEFKNLEENNLSEQSIKSFYSKIDRDIKSQAVGAYDPSRKQVFWAYGDSPVNPLRTNLLIMDEGFGAFIPWRIAQTEGQPKGIVSVFYNRHSPHALLDLPVISLSGESVVDSNNEQILAKDYERREGSSRIMFLFTREEEGDLFFAELYDRSYLDWGLAGYDAYLVTGYNYMGDLSSSKNTPQITVLCERTEKVWGQNFEPTEQSSLLVSVHWDFKTTSAFRPQQAYRINRFEYPTGLGDTFVSESDHIQTSVRPRGRGKTVAIRLEGEHGKAFHLVGFETIDARNSTP